MGNLDVGNRKLVLKIVYYGPALSGKTSNLLSLHDCVDPSHRGEIMSLDTHGDRTLFFDLLPLSITTSSGLSVKLKLFTVPGQVHHDSTRKAVLSRADGVVFVADSRRSQGLSNAEAFQNLATNAARVGLEFDRLPLVVQFNKIDLPDIYTEDEIRTRLQASRWPLVFASAIAGVGVRETLARLLQSIEQRAEGAHRPESMDGLAAGELSAWVAGQGSTNAAGGVTDAVGG